MRTARGSHRQKNRGIHHKHHRLPLSIFVRQSSLDNIVPVTMPQLDDDDHIRARRRSLAELELA
jgi:hypothetical protein